MALSDESSGIPATMLVSPSNVGGGAYPYPVYGGGGQGNGFGNDGGWWIVLLIIVIAALGGNWGGNGNGGGFGGGQPIIVNDGGNGYAVQRGFDQAAVMSGIYGIQSGVQNLSTQLCNCCGDIQMSLANGFAGVEMGANARQMASMQQNFALQSALQNCCCENRESIADLKYTVATENCADRAAISDGIRDVIANQTMGVQRILDQMCSDKIDSKNEKIADLERQLTMANLAASQIAQTSQIVDQTYDRLSSCPVGTVPVFGNQPIFTCPSNQNNCGCGCGCGGNGF